MAAERNEPSFKKPNLINVGIRLGLSLLTNTPLTPRKLEVYTSPEGEKATNKIKRLIKEGYSFLTPITHFSERDVIETLSMISVIKRIAHMPIEVPIAWHQYYNKKYHKLFEKVSSLTGVVFDPIVIEDTINKGANYDLEGNKLDQGYGYKQYLRNARSCLNNKGLIAISPQAGRRDKIELTDDKPLEKLIRSGVDKSKTAFIFIPISLADDKIDYKDAHGFNMKVPYDIRIGPVYTYEEMEKISIMMGVTIDQLSTIILSCFVDPRYNGVELELQKKYQTAARQLST